MGDRGGIPDGGPRENPRSLSSPKAEKFEKWKNFGHLKSGKILDRQTDRLTDRPTDRHLGSWGNTRGRSSRSVCLSKIFPLFKCPKFFHFSNFSALGLDRELGFSRGPPSGIPPRS